MKICLKPAEEKLQIRSDRTVGFDHFIPVGPVYKQTELFIRKLKANEAEWDVFPRVEFTPGLIMEQIHVIKEYFDTLLVIVFLIILDKRHVPANKGATLSGRSHIAMMVEPTGIP